MNEYSFQMVYAFHLDELLIKYLRRIQPVNDISSANEIHTLNITHAYFKDSKHYETYHLCITYREICLGFRKMRSPCKPAVVNTSLSSSPCILNSRSNFFSQSGVVLQAYCDKKVLHL